MIAFYKISDFCLNRESLINGVDYGLTVLMTFYGLTVLMTFFFWLIGKKKYIKDTII